MDSGKLKLKRCCGARVSKGASNSIGYGVSLHPVPSFRCTVSPAVASSASVLPPPPPHTHTRAVSNPSHPLQRSGVLAPADSDSDFSFSLQLSTLDKKLDQLVYAPGPTISLCRGKTWRCTFHRYYGTLKRSRWLIQSDESYGRKRFSGPLAIHCYVASNSHFSIKGYEIYALFWRVAMIVLVKL